MTNFLSSFHPLIQKWFSSTYGNATEIQALCWPEIAAGKHLLATAPTGSGKTLTAFLWAINQFVTGALETGSTRVLYVSPLKALNNDIQRNLVTPLDELRALFAAEGETFPDIRVQTRSGDTAPEERRRMLRHPPEILITTPESLNLLLSSASGLTLLGAIDTVILDEIHGVVGNKRGVYLMTAVERLVPLSGEFQRIALSATVQPMETIAAFVGGHELSGSMLDPQYVAREVSVIRSSAQKHYEISVRYPESAASRPEDEKIWDSLAVDFVERIRKNRSTLLFANSRALCETLTHKINQAAGHVLAYAHHGSLSREIRFEVEQKLKAGELAAIVATSTLEMGIDIGDLDEVILVQSPDAVSSAIQRIGRAGHGVGETSRCTIYPTHPLDFLEAAVLSKAVLEKDIEPIRTVVCPLDVLAQVIISMTGVTEWDQDALFAEVRRSTAYVQLSRQQFDLVINMLAGRYADTHIRELRPRINIDRLSNRIKARKGALMSLYLSGGVIPDRGYFQLRHEESNARIGELDEEFVWEATVGSVFSFGTQQWRIKKITHNDVIVGPGKSNGVAPPFWKAEPLSRDFHFASRVGEFLEYADTRIDDDDFASELTADYHMDAVAARELHTFLRNQRAHSRSPLPHRHHLLVERINMAPGRAQGHQVVFHTGWGARVNRPLAMAIEAGWYETYGEMPEIYASNESLVIQLTEQLSARDVLALAPANAIEQRLRHRLEGSGFFGARFRENAGRALLLSKGRFNERKPLWMSRLQSQKLLDTVQRYEDFPLLLETWRTCLRDEFDLPHLNEVLEELDRGEIAITEMTAESPGPFAQSVAWGQINTYMYMSDAPKTNKTSRLSAGLLEEVVFSPGIRPPVPETIIAEFESRRQRTQPGYAPETEEELIEWVKERTAIPEREWQGALPETGKLRTLRVKDATLIVATEDVDRIAAAFAGDDVERLATHLANWLQYYGPRTVNQIAGLTGIDSRALNAALDQLESDKLIISGALVDGLVDGLVDSDDEPAWCDAANYEVLLRLLRQSSRMAFETLPATAITPFLFEWQVRANETEAIDAVYDTLERFRCYPAAPGLWESEVLPARVPAYEPYLLDAVFAEGAVLWFGTEEHQVGFCFTDELDLLERNATCPGTIDNLLPDAGARYDFSALMTRTGETASDINAALWDGVWQGSVSNDAVSALRKGIDNDFSIPGTPDIAGGARERHRHRGAFNKWRNAIPSAGNWYRIAWPPAEDDLIAGEEAAKDRVRILIDRYGVLFRELLQREMPAFKWASVFRSIRLMELAGELLSGYFFHGIAGPQFISPEGFRRLQRRGDAKGDRIFWINAGDPVSLCGLGLTDLPPLPRRVASNHLVYHGETLVLVSERQGKSLTINVPPSDANLPRYLSVLRHLSHRVHNPVKQVVIETINGEPATTSTYQDVLATAFDLHRDHKALFIERRY